MPRSRSWAMASGGVKPRPPASTRSASRPTICSTSTRAKSATSGRVDGLGRVVARRRPWRRPGRRRRWRTGSRCWPASATRCARGSAAMLDRGALVVGQVDREGGGRVALECGSRLGRRRAGGALDRWRAEAAGGRGGGRPRRQGRRRRRASSQVGAHARDLRVGCGPEGRAGTARPLASGDGSTEGCQVDRCTVLPTFLSKVRACTVGSATGLPPEGRSP